MNTSLPTVIAYSRSTAKEKTLVVHNLSEEPATVKLNVKIDPKANLKDLLTEKNLPMESVEGQLLLHLSPYETLWLSDGV